MFSVAKPHGKEHKAEPGNLRSQHLLSSVPECAVHVRVPIFLVLHPVLLKWRIWCLMPAVSSRFDEKWNDQPAGALRSFDAELVHPKGRMDPCMMCNEQQKKQCLNSPNIRRNLSKPEVNHGRFFGQLWIVAGHHICFSYWVVLLVVFRDHAIPWSI